MRRLSCKKVYCEYCKVAEHLEGACGDSRARRYTANIVGQQSIRKGHAETLVQGGILRIL